MTSVVKINSEFLASTDALAGQTGTSIDGLANGNFIVSW